MLKIFTVLEPQSSQSDLIPKIPSQLPKEGRRSCMDTNLWFSSGFFSASMQGRQFWIHPYYTLKQHT